jgi:ketosteroid isomerase-like protein
MIGSFIAKRKVREAFECFNNRDMHRFFELWDEDAVFIYPGEVSVSGVVTGKTAIQSWFNNLMDCGPSVHFTLKNVAVENILDIVGNNVICAEWENAVTSRDKKTLIIYGVSVIRLKNSKIVHIRDYIFNAEELPVAWCETASLAN